MGKVSDLYQTPPWLVDRLNGEFEFALDIAADTDNSVAPGHLGGPCSAQSYPEYDCNCGLCMRPNWLEGSDSIFCNPPYSDVLPWVKRCRELGMDHPVVLLLHLDPTTEWFRELLDGSTGHRPAELRIPKRRVSFVHPEGCPCRACSRKTTGSNPRASLIAVWAPSALGEPHETRTVWGWE